MNKNQKIAIGCGAVGCLGLIVVVIAGAIVYFYTRRPVISSYNVNSNSNYNSNRNSNRNTNQSSNSSSSNSSSQTSSSMSDDDRHKLFQAAGMTKDAELIQKALKKIGLMRANGTTTDEYGQFIKDHMSWAINNTAFINSVNTPEKATAYVDEHLGD